MSNTILHIKKVVLVLVVLSLIFGLISCTSPTDELSVMWMDTDGTLIESITASKDYDPTERELPSDSDQWHYTEWTVSQSGNIVVCTAQRVSKQHIVWKDYNGTILKETFIIENEKIPSYALPASNEQ